MTLIQALDNARKFYDEQEDPWSGSVESGPEDGDIKSRLGGSETWSGPETYRTKFGADPSIGGEEGDGEASGAGAGDNFWVEAELLESHLGIPLVGPQKPQDGDGSKLTD